MANLTPLPVSTPRARRGRAAHTKRQLALVAWSITHMPPGCSLAELALLAGKLTAGLTTPEQDQVTAFCKDAAAMRQVLYQRSRVARWR
jgi:hypothetical protein